MSNESKHLGTGTEAKKCDETGLYLPVFDNFPQVLKSRNQWILFKAQYNAEKDKWNKPPCGADGRKVSYTNPKNWLPFDKAKEIYRNNRDAFAGVGYVLSEDDGVTVIDLDKCRNPNTGELTSFAQEITEEVGDACVTVSVSGTGLHIWFLGKLPGRGFCNRRLGIEMYDKDRFMAETFTPAFPDDPFCTEVQESRGVIDKLYQRYKSSEKELTVDEHLNWDKTAPITPLDLMRIPKAVKELVKDGKGIEDKYQCNRSDAIMAVFNAMVKAGINKESILYALTDKRNFLAQAALERRKNRTSAVQWLWVYGLRQTTEEHANHLREVDLELETLDENTRIMEEVEVIKAEDIDDNDDLIESMTKKLKYTSKYQYNAATYLFRYPTKVHKGVVYEYNNRWWDKKSDNYLMANVFGELGVKFAEDSKGVDEHLKMGVKRDTLVEIRCRAHVEHFTSSPGLIGFENTVLDISDPRNPAEIPFAPEHNLTGISNITYDPGATYPNFKKLLESQWGEDSDEERLLAQWFGYNLVEDYRHQKFMMLNGASRSGKSLCVRVLEKIVGKAYCASKTPRNIVGIHGTQDLPGKKVLIIPDLKKLNKDVIEPFMEVVQNITGRDLMGINPKNKEPYDAYIDAKITMTGNKIPLFMEDHPAYLNRMMIVVFPRTFQGKEDINLETKLMEELPGIFNWCLRGLADLYTSGQFIEPQSSAAERQELLSRANPVNGFLDAFTKEGGKESDSVPKSELYNAYTRWCQVRGVTPEVQVHFWRKFKQRYPDVEITKIQRNKKRVGVCLRLILLNNLLNEVLENNDDHLEDELEDFLD